MYVTALQMRLSHRWRETGHKADDPEDMRPPASGRPASLGFDPATSSLNTTSC